MFSFRARAEKGIARHIDASSVVGTDLVIFDWFVLSMRMQVILDSSFARPGSAPIWGGKKGEFRDWTKISRTYSDVVQINEKFVHNCPPCLLAEMAKVASSVARPRKCCINCLERFI